MDLKVCLQQLDVEVVVERSVVVSVGVHLLLVVAQYNLKFDEQLDHMQLG